MNTFFMHINNHVDNGINNKLYKRKSKPKPSYTLAGVLKDNNIKIGISQCSPKDQFIKKLGRIRAEGRANAKDAIIIEVPSDVIENKTFGKFFVEECKKLIK